MAGLAPLTCRGLSDARDWLVEAEEPLASLQTRNGGELPGPIVTPAILELVRKARAYKLRLSRAITARDGHERVTAWVEVDPHRDGEGCAIAITNWRSGPASDPTPDRERERHAAVIRQAAELSARLGAKQEVLAVESDCAELQDLLTAMREGRGKPWTDFVTVEGNAHEQPMHWRLLDGARIAIDGAARDWRAWLIPVGKAGSGSDGFELYFVADTPMPEKPTTPAVAAPEKKRAGLGFDIAPVLRQPVARIIANAETIRAQLAGPLAEEYSNYAADIATAGEHLLALIDDLTTLEMVEASGFEPAPDQIDLADLARRAAGILGVRAREKAITLENPPVGASAPAIGEFRRVLQILLNLVGNAIRYSPEGTSVALSVEQRGKRARIVVADQGEGLDPDEQKRIFNKFERLGRSGDGGSGLGLYISRRLAEAMGGTLTVESTKGEGARFLLELPADLDA